MAGCSTRECSGRIEGWLSEKFVVLTHGIAYAPKRTVVYGVVCVLLSSVGWMRFRTEDDANRFLVPQDTRAIRDRKFVEDRFSDSPSPSQALLNRRGDGANVLTKEAMLQVMDLHEAVLGISSRGSTAGYDERTCSLVFWRSPGSLPCAVESILAFWDYNRTTLEADPDVVATVNRRNGQEGECCSPRFRRFDVSQYAAKIGYEADGRVSKIGALSNVYFLRTDLHSKVRRDPTVYRLERKFDRLVRKQNLDAFERPMALTPAGANVNVEAGFDFDRQIVTLAFVAISAYAFFALTRFRRRRRRCLRCSWPCGLPPQGGGGEEGVVAEGAEKNATYLARGSLGLQAVCVVALAVASAWGVVFAFGLEATPLASVAAFLVLGIGLDDAFVIVGALDDDAEFDDDALAVAEGRDTVDDLAARRACRALAVAGPSITTTSVTDAAAFFAGSYTRIPAIHSFCIFAAVSVVVDFLLQITVFVALYVLDTRAKLRRRAKDLKRTDDDDDVEEQPHDLEEEEHEHSEEEEEGPSSSSSSSSTTTREKRKKKKYLSGAEAPVQDEDEQVVGTPGIEENEGQKYTASAMMEAARSDREAKAVATAYRKSWFGRVYAKYLLSPLGLAFVFAATATILGVAAVGCLRYEMEFNYNWFYVESLRNGYVVRSDDFQREFFPGLGAGEDSSSSFNVYTKKADYFALQGQMDELLRRFGGLGFVQSASLESNWFSAHRAWVVASSSQSGGNTTTTTSSIGSNDEYVASVKAFLETEDGAAYSTKVVFTEDGATIAATEIETFWDASDTTQQAINRMRQARRTAKDAAPELRPIVYATIFVWLQGLAVVTSETVRALGIACSVVVVVLVCLLGDLAVAALVSGFVASTCVCTFGAIHWYGDSLNFISAFFVVVSVGLASDAAAHVAHAYINAPTAYTTGHQRATHALDTLGSSVFRGNFSTLLGVLLMGLARNYVFQTFFWYLTTIMVLAIWFGLAVAPATLAVLGPYLVSTAPLADAAPSSKSSDDDLELVAHQNTTMNTTTTPPPGVVVVTVGDDQHDHDDD
eukprot:CAMPEP_0118913806 /NCGR_PEP_ID=MMETSP1166-20130328/14447_1 /TAXON_ID=1104430 /ORGANISM="Chrysoreinhardia sp, Strain CCMP3193" /LENGTH=1048 /DNA_ID=CAMNT_0006853371 /DNA_START=59 /DNA_END=3205 /DNA_ORIENTATION=-